MILGMTLYKALTLGLAGRWQMQCLQQSEQNRFDPPDLRKD